jgi:hypothetical protein
MFYCPRLNFAFARLFPLIGFQIITEPGSPEDLPCLERDKPSNRRTQHDGFRRNGNNNRRLCFGAQPGIPLWILRFESGPVEELPANRRRLTPPFHPDAQRLIERTPRSRLLITLFEVLAFRTEMFQPAFQAIPLVQRPPGHVPMAVAPETTHAPGGMFHPGRFLGSRRRVNRINERKIYPGFRAWPKCPFLRRVGRIGAGDG